MLLHIPLLHTRQGKVRGTEVQPVSRAGETDRHSCSGSGSERCGGQTVQLQAASRGPVLVLTPHPGEATATEHTVPPCVHCWTTTSKEAFLGVEVPPGCVVGGRQCLGQHRSAPVSTGRRHCGRERAQLPQVTASAVLSTGREPLPSTPHTRNRRHTESADRGVSRPPYDGLEVLIC